MNIDFFKNFKINPDKRLNYKKRKFKITNYNFDAVVSYCNENQTFENNNNNIEIHKVKLNLYYKKPVFNFEEEFKFFEIPKKDININKIFSINNNYKCLQNNFSKSNEIKDFCIFEKFN